MSGLMVLLGVAAVALSLLTVGCNTSGAKLDHDVIPAGCEDAFFAGRSSAVDWFRRKYGAAPYIPALKVEVVTQSRISGDWAVTVSASRVLISEAVPQDKKRGVLAHEWRHVLNKANGKMDTEETVK
jgi:hypothetical protein